MVKQILAFLNVADPDAYAKWLEGAKTNAEPALAKMLINPGKDAAGLGATSSRSSVIYSTSAET